MMMNKFDVVVNVRNPDRSRERFTITATCRNHREAKAAAWDELLTDGLMDSDPIIESISIVRGLYGRPVVVDAE